MGLTIIDSNNIFQKDVIGNVRKAQEDSHDIAALTPNGDVFVVCDGMGGHVGGKQASSIAVKSIIDYLKKERYHQPIQALNDALQFANMQILGYANEHPELKGMGTTACIVLLQDSVAFIAHVGDSRIYLYLGKEKQLHRITKDHSYVQTLVDAGQITDEQAEHHPNKNRIMKALGIKPDLSPSFDMVKPKNGDVFLICSDGLSGMISDSTIKDVLVQNYTLEFKGEKLVDLALNAGGNDNITLELVMISNSPHQNSTFRSYNPKNNGTPPGNKRGSFVLLGIVTAFVLILCSLLLVYFYILRNNTEKQLKQIQTEIVEIDSKIDSTKSDIKEYRMKQKVLYDDLQMKISKIDDTSLRGEIKRNYNEQSNNIEAAIRDAEKRLTQYSHQRDSLNHKYKTDSAQITKMIRKLN